MPWSGACAFFHVRVCAPGCAKLPVKLHWTLIVFIGVSCIGSILHFDLPKLILSIVYASLGIYLSALSVGLAQLSAASCCCNCQASAIVVWPIGAVTIYDMPPARHSHRLVIALVGVLMHAAMFALWIGIMSAFGCGIGEATTGEDGSHLLPAGTSCLINPLTQKADYDDSFSTLALWMAELSFMMVYYNACARLRVSIPSACASACLRVALRLCLSASLPPPPLPLPPLPLPPLLRLFR